MTVVYFVVKIGIVKVADVVVKCTYVDVVVVKVVV